MKPEQMLKSVPDASPPPSQETGQRPRPVPALVNHVVKILSPPAPQGRKRYHRSEMEPWELEQLEKGNCPICLHKILHMVCPTYGPETHFYTCEEFPKDHAWTVLE